jgi:hypothetical protein
MDLTSCPRPLLIIFAQQRNGKITKTAVAITAIIIPITILSSPCACFLELEEDFDEVLLFVPDEDLLLVPWEVVLLPCELLPELGFLPVLAATFYPPNN